MTPDELNAIQKRFVEYETYLPIVAVEDMKALIVALEPKVRVEPDEIGDWRWLLRIPWPGAKYPDGHD